jgi:hypothetical protein
MDVQWKMRAVNGEIALEAQAEFALAGSGDWHPALPEQAVMDQEEIDSAVDCLNHDRLTGIDGGPDAGNEAPVFHLQTIPSTREVLDFKGLEVMVHPGHGFGQRNGGHGSAWTIVSGD